MKWSKEQLKAIETKNKNILVTAAAGSGKTAVLVERIINHITSGFCNIDEILVVTFTKAAAGEMKERIASAIYEKLDAKKREKQLVLLNMASISTLHSFCQNLLRKYFYHLDLDPKFRIATEQEINLLQAETLEEMFYNLYEKMDRKEDAEILTYFETIIDLYGTEKGDDHIHSLILSLYKFAISKHFFRDWLLNLPDAYENLDVKDNIYLTILKNHLKGELETAKNTLEKLENEAKEYNSAKFLKLIKEDLEIVNALSFDMNHNWDLFVEGVFSLKFPRFSDDKELDGEFRNYFKETRTNAVADIKKWKDDYALATIEEMEKSTFALKKQVEALVQMTLYFVEEFQRKKREKNLLDFPDLEHFTMDLLVKKEGDALTKTTVAEELHTKYKEIMVDEYQDVNEVQEFILTISAGDEPKKFYVGDVKQSIYKFRLAEPNLFLHKYHTYPQDSSAIRIDLAQNFRSRENILDGTNFIFAQIMNPKVLEIPYEEDAYFKKGFPYEEQNGNYFSAIDIHLFGEEFPYEKVANGEVISESSFKGEINFIIDEIKEMMKKEVVVYDKHLKDYRPIMYKDIVILLRSVKEKGKALFDALNKEGIPVYSAIDDGYFKATEVDLVLNMLKIIDNPQQDIPLCSVLFSNMGNFTRNDIAKIKGEYKDLNLYFALREFKGKKTKLGAKVKNFLERLESFRAYSQFNSVSKLLWKIYEDTYYYEYVGTLAEGSQRQANLRALISRAKEYENTNYRGLFRFLNYIQKLRSLGNDLSIARNLSENENVVRIMTIHKSKGLEFPVVFLPNVNKKVNLKDLQNSMLLHKDLGMGLYLKENNASYENLQRQSIKFKIIEEMVAEEARILYVAMTRAREKLIISGSSIKLNALKNLLNKVKNSQILLEENLLKNARSFLDFLVLPLSRHKDFSLHVHFDLNNHPKIDSLNSRFNFYLGGRKDSEGESKKLADLNFWQRIKKLEPIENIDSPNFVAERFNFVYQNKKALTVPSKVSVTEIKKAFMDDNYEVYTKKDETTLRKPKFITETEDVKGTMYGSFIHKIFQHIDINGDLTLMGIKKQVKDLMASNILTRDNKFHIPYKKIESFFSSPLGIRLKNATFVERELYFNKMIDGKILFKDEENPQDIFLQGVVDLIFKDGDDYILLDYKTDNISEDLALEKYAPQLLLYKSAMEEIFRCEIKEVYLYMITTEKLIKIDGNYKVFDEREK